MEVSNAMRLRQLEGGNARLRKMVVEQAVVEFATAFSAHGQVSASNDLRKGTSSFHRQAYAPSGFAITFRP